MPKILKSAQFKLSCPCCGGVDFKNNHLKVHEVENMYFIRDNTEVKCLKCGLEDYIDNLIPRGFYHEELID